tara:strand:+ start:211 stop:417 length:207 start_codon:yes stop_codon:yes gene_type:complete
MTDLKNNIFKNILAKKFNQANKSFDSVMKSKVFTGIDNFKKTFVYNPKDSSGEEIPAETPKEAPKEDV